MTTVGVYDSDAARQRRFRYRLGVALPVVGVAAVVGSIVGFTWVLSGVLG